jgi:hypothetical protein
MHLQVTIACLLSAVPRTTRMVLFIEVGELRHSRARAHGHWTDLKLEYVIAFEAINMSAQLTSSIRNDEEFAITAIAAAFGGSWRPGENPPDAYLTVGTESIAVELTQQVPGAEGMHSRLSDDMPAVALARQLNQQMALSIPDGYTVGLILRSPIFEYRKTKAQLEIAIHEQLRDLGMLNIDQRIEINGNEITLWLDYHGQTNFDKVSAVIANCNSSPNILSNVISILANRIATKANKYLHLQKRGSIWLALLNDYWPADADTYRQALLRLTLDHPFQKILIVGGNGSVEHLSGH